MSLVLGPVLRHVGETTAQVWVETERRCTVSVLGASTPTFEVAGHHYALVPVTGLAPDSSTAYTVEVDGEPVWPPATSAFPPSVIRTRGPAAAGQLRVIFGSCRYAKVADPKVAARFGIDALDAYSARMAQRPTSEWPDALFLLGDQVYADNLTARQQRRVVASGDRPPEWPADEAVGYGEYAGLYRDAWSGPEVRWLLSTVPTAMIFDDHDIRDDWNTSSAWRAEIRTRSWWPERIRAGLASYWVYQHLGNLSPAEFAADADVRKVLEHGGDTWPLLAELAARADAETDGVKGVRFSFRWDLGRSRLIMIDSRNGRILDAGARLMLSDVEFEWVERQVDAPGAVDHLLLGSSLPWLLPHAISDLQTVNEIVADRPGPRGRLAEKVRQAADLDHWAAFRASFDRLTAMIGRAAASGSASISVLSGDVHHSYAARAELAGAPPARPVHQLTCSPVHNKLDWFVVPGFRLAWSRWARRFAQRWAARRGVPAAAVGWEKVAGPFFGNTIATLDIDGRRATALFEQPRSAASLTERARLELTP